MNSKKPCVAFLIATYRCGKILETTLESILNQTSVDWEICIKDACSSDAETLEVFEKYKDKIAHLRMESDRGIYDAWNQALPDILAEWVMCLGAGDMLYNQHVVEIFSQKSASIKANIVYGKVMLINHAGESIEELNGPWDSLEDSFKCHMSLCHQGVFHRTTWLRELGGFKTSYKIAGDYELLLRSYIHENPHYLGDDVISKMLLGGASTSEKNILKTLKEFQRARRENGFYRLTSYDIKTTILSWVKYALWNFLPEKTYKKLQNGMRMLTGRKPR